MQGDFHSVFKGTGLEFEDVRPYQYGDDVRTIDWNVSAKGHGTFIKVFREEKEQTVFFIVDVSASGNIGSLRRTKLDVAKEICGVLALSAVKEGSHTGLLCYSDQKESFVKPNKGDIHALRLIHTLFALKPVSRATHLSGALYMAMKLIRRKSVMVLLTDFMDDGYEDALKTMAAKHDLIVLHIGDPKEQKLPGLGIIPVYQIEEQRTVWINSSSDHFKTKLSKLFLGKVVTLKHTLAASKASYAQVTTQDDFVPQLIELFRRRRGR